MFTKADDSSNSISEQIFDSPDSEYLADLNISKEIVKKKLEALRKDKVQDQMSCLRDSWKSWEKKYGAH